MKAALLVAIAFALARLPLAAALELCPDEAYYWLWSQRLELSYFDHPPMAAWLIAAATSVLGQAEWVVRLPALLCGIVVPVALARTAWELAPPASRERAALATALLACVMPLMHAGAVIVTPDSPGAAAWSVALAALCVARRDEARSARAWWIAGAAIGFALLSKYTTALIGFSMLCLVPFDAPLRRTLRTPHPWGAAILSFAIFAPVLWWNASHDWVSFAFQLDHGTASGRGGPRGLLDLLGSQLAILTPPLAALLALHVWRGGNAADRDGDRFLTFAVLPTFLVFAALSLKSRPEANWPAFAWLGAAVIGGLAAARATRERVILYRSTVALGALASIVVSIHAVYPLVHPKRDRLREEFSGWRARGAAARHAAGPTGWILGDSYRVAAEMAYYGGQRTENIGVARREGERRSMFDVWGRALPPDAGLVGASAIYVSARKREIPREWAGAFERVEMLELPAGVRGTLARLVNCHTLPGARTGMARTTAPDHE